ncbi:nucleotide sugar dehydrogenase [Frigidibacter sp.]|uniref:nucleotide sugar dehydrogenase n=1 Tax=Frigidibacter sp. TaxID=2586418 RepID=UPI00273716B3|nr:nucleotide sugar dehydrogenase [Frigidibacter sp.]MDP3340495.1 nucleotide sugar dehydrogenase [Frigidibacter sp.]
MANISVFGIGYVGVVSAACLARDGHAVMAVDIDQNRVDVINSGRSPIVENGLDDLISDAVETGHLIATLDAEAAILNTDASFVCVGTPSNADGSVGLSYVKGACEIIGRAIAKKSAFHSVIIRSTIVPGTMESVCIPALEAASGLKAGVDFGVGYYPEFLRESTAIADYDNPGLIVFGALDKPTFAILNLLNKNMPCVTHEVDLRTAEMVKYTSNTWRAVKVTFANEIGNIAKACGLDGQLVMKLLCSDDKVNISSHFMRPGFAFGGSCLPKDVRALQQLAKARDVEAPLMAAVLQANEAQIGRAERMVTGSGKSVVGLVGISFKPGTDDLRESPLAELASRLIAQGHDVQVYDPNVSTAHAHDTTAGRGNDVVPDLRDRMVPTIEALIGASDILLIGNTYPEAVSPLQKAMASQPMVDLTRLQAGVVSNGAYQGICW